MSLNVFTESIEWYQSRAICFYAEEGYMELNPNVVRFVPAKDILDITLTDDLKRILLSRDLIGVLAYTDDVDASLYGRIAAAYFNSGDHPILIKNPSNTEESRVGKRSAIGFDGKNISLFYCNNGINWKFGRRLATKPEMIGDVRQELFVLENIVMGPELLLPKDSVTQLIQFLKRSPHFQNLPDNKTEAGQSIFANNQIYEQAFLVVSNDDRLVDTLNQWYIDFANQEF